MVNKTLINKIEPILRKHDVSFAALFGSHARGDHRPESDFDVLVRFNTPKGLFDIADLERDLSDELNAPVDLVTEGALSPLLRAEILKDLQPIYGAR